MNKSVEIKYVLKFQRLGIHTLCLNDTSHVTNTRLNLEFLLQVYDNEFKESSQKRRYGGSDINN